MQFLARSAEDVVDSHTGSTSGLLTRQGCASLCLLKAERRQADLPSTWHDRQPASGDREVLNQTKVLARQLRNSLPKWCWEGVTDPRGRQGRRYRFDGLMMLVVLGFASACRALRDVERLGKEMVCRRTFRLGAGPSDTTLDTLIRRTCPVELESVLVGFVRQMIRSKQVENLREVGISLTAIDGKRFGTSDEAEHPASRSGGRNSAPYYQVHALRAVHVSSAVKPVLGQRVVEVGDGEVNTFWSFVDELVENYGSFIECLTFDAGMTSYRNLLRFREKGLFYIAALKGNCGRPRGWAERTLGQGESPPPGGWEAHTVTFEGTKRTTRRFARVAAEGLREVHWQGVATQVWRVHAGVEHRDGTVSEEDRFFLTNLEWRRLTPAQGLAAVRAHWGIENDCFWTLDVKLGEDRVTWVNQGEASEVLAILQLIAYNLLRVMRHRVLRSEENRAVPWRTLQNWVRDALLQREAWEPDGIG